MNFYRNGFSTIATFTALIFSRLRDIDNVKMQLWEKICLCLEWESETKTTSYDFFPVSCYLCIITLILFFPSLCLHHGQMVNLIYHDSNFSRECVTDSDSQSKMIISESLLTTFEFSVNFWVIIYKSKNWLEPKTKPP
jgi:hypothetical protein